MHLNLRQTPTRPQANQGVALLSALMIVVFIAATISIWIIQTKQYLLREERVSESLQAWQFEEGANLWAVNALNTNINFKLAKPVLLTSTGTEIKIPKSWKMQISLIDAQSQFNINNLQEDQMQINFVLLLQNVLKSATSVQIKEILNATLTWINPEPDPKLLQTYNQIYLKANPAYQNAGQPMVDVSEFKKVAGVTPAMYQALYPYLSALPQTAPININTCPALLLKSLKPGLTDANVQKIIFARGQQGFGGDDELFTVLQQLQLPVQNTTTNSQYYYLDIQMVAPSGRKTHLRNLFYRPLSNNSNQTTVSLIQRTQL
jgi:general secretion pathway protein K